MAWTLSAFADEAADSIDEQIEELTKAKIDHIDLRNADGVNIVDLPLDHAERIRRKLDAAGIAVCMYGAPIGKLDLADDFEADVKRLRHLGELKEVFGAEAVRIFSYYNRKDPVADAAWRDASLDRLRRLIDEAERLGLVLYHENELGIYGGPIEQVCVLRDELHRQSPERFRLIFDFDNFNQNAEDVWADYVELRDSIGAIHLKESRRQPDGTYQHVPAGEGDGQIARVLGDLADRGWEGPLTLEPHLARSAGVLATGAHGRANEKLADLTTQECFQVGAVAARNLLRTVGKLD